MTFAAKNRLFLLAVAILPPLLIMTVVYFTSVKQVKEAERDFVKNSLLKFNENYFLYKKEIQKNIKDYTQSNNFIQNLNRIKLSRNETTINNIPVLSFDIAAYNLDFIEILDKNQKVLSSNHRPGLIDQKYPEIELDLTEIDTSAFETIEYDINGTHPSLSFIIRLPDSLFLYTGKFITERDIKQFQEIIENDITLYYDSLPQPFFQTMDPLTIYQNSDAYFILLAGTNEADFYLCSLYKRGQENSIFASLLETTAIVASLSVLAAILFGLYFSQRTKKEIDNLVLASNRIARGDFSTPVMAYNEGEFSTLADAFTYMMSELKDLQKKLSTTEKIAAWQTVGRKIAHELKNPLTPISISVDDLHRTYYENQDKFEDSLKETTSTVKDEINRMNKMLNEFVSFARMKNSEPRATNSLEFFKSFEKLYQHEISEQNLSIDNRLDNTQINIDPDTFKQAIINIVKNGLESKDSAKVTVAIDNQDNELTVTIEDNGPGFPDNKLNNSFEPYVTTKPDGSGLGLVIAHRIINDHQGTLEIYNHENGGGVKITIPL